MSVRVCRPKLFKNLCLSLVSGVPHFFFRTTPHRCLKLVSIVLAEFSVGQFLEQAGLAGAGGRPEVADDARHVDVVTAQSVVARRRIRQLRLLATLACTHTQPAQTRFRRQAAILSQFTPPTPTRHNRRVFVASGGVN